MNIMEYLREHQLDLMLLLIGMCLLLTFFVAIAKNLSPRRKASLLIMEAGALLLLTFDRYAYIFRGDTSRLGWYMVRISNFMVFSLSLAIIFGFNMYLVDLYKNEGGLQKVPVPLAVIPYILSAGELLIIISQFTGLYYTFDETNHYQRAGGFIVCYIFPIVVLLTQLAVIIRYKNGISRYIRYSLVLFTAVPFAASVLQIFAYGLSLTNITTVGLVIQLYIFSLFDMNDKLEKASEREIELIRTDRENIRRMFEQTASALASAIDAKDKYTHGHSRRVAEYSGMLAELSGKSEKERDEVYFAALLHDVGKIGIRSSIINKDGKLTDEEYTAIKSHTVIGKQILSSINRSPYLKIGANFHHERYDGRGYPEQLKGDDIPEIARIIAVADAYDAMTSKRSYRDPLPQQIVREELIKGSGTQFDPYYAKLMLQLIDNDIEYRMKERSEVRELSGSNEMHCGEYRADVSEGIHIQSRPVKIHMRSKTDQGYPPESCLPTLILFDALDHRVHMTESEIRDMLYHEYAEIRIDGKYNAQGVRKVRETVTELAPVTRGKAEEIKNSGLAIEVEAVRKRDHILVKITTDYHVREYILAKEDSVCYVFIALTGEHCNITDVDITESEEEIGADYIPRICDEISYIDVPAGDIPNLQIDEGWCASATPGIPVTDGMKISFRSKSLPTARLIWHCPYIVLFTSDDGQFKGENYRELTLIRFDGESWESEGEIDNKPVITINDGFTDWNTWKSLNKQGMDFEVSFGRDGNTVTTETENVGISIKDVLTVNFDVPEIYAAITGDQIAVTNIHISTGQ